MNVTEILNSIVSIKDYKERFKIEYCETVIRVTKLKNMLIKWDNSQLDFEPTCPREIYDTQLCYMTAYLDVLKTRAKLENIDIDIKEITPSN